MTLFVANTFMVLVVSAVGYFFAPSLFSGMGEPETVETGVRTTRKLLPLAVALYMFFNCVGYFEQRTPYLVGVSILILVDLTLQLVLRYKRRRLSADEGDD